MATYLLKEGEVEVRTENPSWLVLLKHIFLTFILFGFWAPFLVWAILRRTTTQYVITNMRVIWVYGILGKSSKESPLDKINNVSHKQSLFGRIFNYGDVQLQTASEMGATQFPFIPSPSQFKSEIVNQTDLFKKAEIKNQAQVMAQAMAGPETKAVSDDDTKICPFCAETIKKNAQVCRYCSRSLDEQLEPSEQQENVSSSELVKRAVDHYKSGDVNKALEDLNNAIELNPKHSPAFFNRGLMYNKLRKNDRAIADLKIAASLGHPKAQKLLSDKGII